MLIAAAVLDGDLRKVFALGRRCVLQARSGASRDFEVRPRQGTLGFGDYRRPASVRLLANADVERQAPQQLDRVLLSHARTAPRAEDRLFMTAFRAHVRAHVLDDTEHRHRYLLEHAQPLAGIEQRDVLGRGDDDGTADGHALRKRELDVTRARRHVHDQVVEGAPACVIQQLQQRLRDHRTAPHHRLLLVDEEADRHHFETVGNEWLERLAVTCGRTLPAQSQHARLARSVDVRIENPHFRAQRRPRQRKVGSHG
jgi:hypothetical protein